MGKPGGSAAAESWRNVRRPLSGINVRKAEIQAPLRERQLLAYFEERHRGGIVL
jgi:hypothetical protein